MPLTAMAIQILEVLAALLCVFVVGAQLLLDLLFEEPRAKRISSLAKHLSAQSILGVFAHPDDEIHAAGTLAEASSRDGVTVWTITATRGEAKCDIPKPVCRPEDLPLIRHAELLKHGFVLGIDHQEVWSYADRQLEHQIDALILELVGRIRTLQPELLLTFDPASGYSWHPDHKAIGRATTEAFRLANLPAFHPELGFPHQPKWLVYILVPRRVMNFFGGKSGRQVAQYQVEAQYAVPIARSLKTRGWRIHESQYSSIRQDWHVPLWFLYFFFDKEHYFVQAAENPR